MTDWQFGLFGAACLMIVVILNQIANRLVEISRQLRNLHSYLEAREDVIPDQLDRSLSQISSDLDRAFPRPYRDD